jgi:hypothetical protein
MLLVVPDEEILLHERNANNEHGPPVLLVMLTAFVFFALGSQCQPRCYDNNNKVVVLLTDPS